MSESTTTDAWTRFAIDRESAGNDSGSFRAILATNGEASDGHILSIDGMRVPDSMPMLFRHQSTIEIPTLGRIVDPVKTRESGGEVLRVTGRFNLEGESNDPMLAIRKGFDSLVRSGDLDAMSVRWDPVFGKFVPRASLDESHHAFVPRGTDGPSAFGMFFEESLAQEGSIVAIGADPSALMGRANDSQSAFEEAYWTVLAGRMGRGEAMPEIPAENRTLFEAMTKVVVEAVREEAREAFQLRREPEPERSESPSEPVTVETETEETSREVSVEATKETKPPEPRHIGGDELLGLLRETADDRVKRKIAFALGRVA